MASEPSDTKAIQIPSAAVVQARLKDLEIEQRALRRLLQSAVLNESRKYVGNNNARRGR